MIVLTPKPVSSQLEGVSLVRSTDTQTFLGCFRSPPWDAAGCIAFDSRYIRRSLKLPIQKPTADKVPPESRWVDPVAAQSLSCAWYACRRHSTPKQRRQNPSLC